MLENFLRIIKKILPNKLFRFTQPVYHFLLAYIGAVIYGFPAKKIKIVAVTGTKGKTTTTELLNAVLESAGYKTALQNGIRFKIGEKENSNEYKMSMPGRMFMQRFLKKAVNQKCDWAILEMTSEGARFYRHLYIDLDALIFTNLAPEHIESHGSYEAYREAKLSIADNLKNKKGSIVIVNGHDPESKHFLKKEASQKISYQKEDFYPYNTTDKGVSLTIDKTTIFSKLRGEFNLLNIIAVITFAKAIGLNSEKIKTGIESLETILGRVQKVENDKNIEVYVDYAHTPESLEALYKEFSREKKLICVLGNAGGGRDTWKRSAMAKIADQYCHKIILTDEDPYDEEPRFIVDQMAKAIDKTPFEIIMDRREAIAKALRLANKDHIVLITGKGGDRFLMGPNGQKTPWIDAEVVVEELKKLD
ncbi:UDP-N-acetylmuramyl-tripeptide synthetase [Candidatus Nomurabacteria bacterium]|nr:UDP-N-acetylmuramyl-tripeptide synthetase [Candidatus Nomurabacteria bacterium]